ncbi:maltose ABC transporter permease [Candidatus Bathyarchaeota archaeon]|nr:MAG: maltose ABC transporter permease [Candidatus Bathyarchaeota archaeon]
MKKRMLTLILTVLLTASAVLIVVIFLFPIYWVVLSSIRPYGSLFTTKFELIPSEVTWEAYTWLIFESKFFLWLRNSLIVSILTVVFTLVLVIPSAYSFSRFKFFGKEKFLYGYLVFTQFAGGMGIAGLIALYAILAYLNLLNSLFVLALIYAAGGVPFNTWLLKTYFDTIPRDFDEAALVDGASYFNLIVDVLLPIAKPGIATVAIFSFMGAWGEFILAQTILSPENYTLPVGLYSFVGQFETKWNYFSAMAILFAVPVVVMYLLAQRYLQMGLAMGGVKK